MFLEDQLGLISIEGVFSTKKKAQDKETYTKKHNPGGKTRIEIRPLDNDLGFMVGYWHTKRNAEGKVTHAAKLRLEPFGDDPNQ